MATSSPIAATRFGISIDGVQIASFSELQGITSKVEVLPKKTRLLAHELTHVVQQHVGKNNIIIRLNSPSSDRTSLDRLRRSTGREIKLTAYNKSGAPTLTIKGKAVKIETDVMQQEWSLTYETIQRVL